MAPIALLLIVATIRHPEKPDIDVTGGLVYDAGRVPPGRLLTHIYHVNNPHSFPIGLSITKIGCECTTAQTTAKLIPAHGSADIAMHVQQEGANNISAGVCVTATHGTNRTETWLLLTGRTDNHPGNIHKRFPPSGDASVHHS